MVHVCSENTLGADPFTLQPQRVTHATRPGPSTCAHTIVGYTHGLAHGLNTHSHSHTHDPIHNQPPFLHTCPGPSTLMHHPRNLGCHPPPLAPTSPVSPSTTITSPAPLVRRANVFSLASLAPTSLAYLDLFCFPASSRVRNHSFYRIPYT
jgi:hypothetical protein